MTRSWCSKLWAAFAAAAGRVDHERRRVEAGRDPAERLLDVERGLQRGAEILDALHEVVHVDRVGLDLAVPEARTMAWAGCRWVGFRRRRPARSELRS